jgi:hypothetical protein
MGFCHFLFHFYHEKNSNLKIDKNSQISKTISSFVVAKCGISRPHDPDPYIKNKDPQSWSVLLDERVYSIKI